eukprot:3994200-Amphidinium_carterae.1
MPEEVLELAHNFMNMPFRLLVRREEISLEGIRQFYVPVEHEKWKFDTLCDLYNSMTITQSVIFCNNKKKVDWLAQHLRAANFPIASIHGDMAQKEPESKKCIPSSVSPSGPLLENAAHNLTLHH